MKGLESAGATKGTSEHLSCMEHRRSLSLGTNRLGIIENEGTGRRRWDEAESGSSQTISGKGDDS